MDERTSIDAYNKSLSAFRADLLRRLRAHLAEVNADIEAEQGNPDAQRYHRGRAFILQIQIEQHLKIDTEIAEATESEKMSWIPSILPGTNKRRAQ